MKSKYIMLSTVLFLSTYIMAQPAKKNMKQKGDPTLVSSAEELQKIASYTKGSYKYTVEDFFKNPEKEDYALSPSGAYIAYLAPFKNRMNIHVQKIGEDNVTRITEFTDRDLAGYFWKSDNTLLYIKDQNGDENYKLYAVDRTTQKTKTLTPFEGVRIQFVDDLEMDDQHVIIEMNKENPAVFEPYKINVLTGELKKLADNKDEANPISGWVTDHNGDIRVAIQTVDGTNTRILYRKDISQPFKEVITTNYKQNLSPLFFDFDNGDVIYAVSNLGRDKAALVKYNLAFNKELEVLYEHPAVDIDELVYSKKRKQLLYTSHYYDRKEFKFLDNETQKMFETIQEKLGGVDIRIVGHSRNEDKYLIITKSDRSRGTYYLYDKTTINLTKLAEIAPWLNAEDMCEMRTVEYQTRDGFTIQAYLTLPKNSEGKKLPLVVNPHGGPWARDYWGFNPEVQLLASRGYAVLQMNFRGSTGFGRKFWESSFKQWGNTMQNDITDGVEFLVKSGVADSKRVAIYGGSYGGYATLAGVTYTPDLYACAVDYVGVSNLFTFLQTIPPYWKPYLEMMYEQVGHPEKDKDIMTQFSPALNVDKIKTPLLVVQGAHDPRVNIDESDQIVKALRARKVDVPYMVKYNEGHGFHNEENRIEFYKVMTGFIAKYLNK